MSINDYKLKYNVNTIHHCYDNTKKKIGLKNLNHIVTEDVRQRTSQTLLNLHRIPWSKGKTKETNKRLMHMSEVKKKSFLEHPEKKEVISNTLKKLYSEGMTTWNKDLTVEIDERLRNSINKMKNTYKQNPRLQINYRLAQKRKNKIMFGGEDKFNWILKNAGYIRDKDYTYNKYVTVYDLIKKEKRTFYPDFLIKNKYIVEIDGFCHENKKAREFDLDRERVLKENGYIFLDRIIHKKLFDKQFLSNKIIEYETYKNLIFNYMGN